MPKVDVKRLIDQCKRRRLIMEAGNLEPPTLVAAYLNCLTSYAVSGYHIKGKEWRLMGANAIRTRTKMISFHMITNNSQYESRFSLSIWRLRYR